MAPFNLKTRETGPTVNSYRVILPADPELASKLEYAILFGDSAALWADRPDVDPWYIEDDDMDD